MRREKLRSEARRLICSNGMKWLEKHTNGHMKERCKMIQAEIFLVTVNNETETVLLIFMGMINQNTYGMEQISSTDLSTTVEQEPRTF